MKKKIILTLLILLVVGIGIFLGLNYLKNNKANVSYDVSAPIEIAWWHTLDSQYDEYIATIVKKFNESQDKITVHAEYMGSWNDINEALVAANAASKGLPAVAVCNTKFLAAYGESGLFEDLTNYISGTNYDVSDFAEGIYSTATYNGKQVAMPFLHNTQVIYYNKTMAQKYNLKIPAKLSDVDSFFKNVKSKTGVTPLSMQSLDFYYGTIYRNAGVDIISNDKCDLNSEESINITAQFKNWCDAGLVSWLQGTDASSNMKQAFYNEKTFAVLHNSSALPTYIENCDFEVGMAWYPGVNGVAKADLGGGVIGIPSKNNQETKNAAWVFIQYLCGEELNAELSIKTGNVPTRKTALASDDIKEYLSEYPEYKTVYDNLENIYPPIIHQSASEIVKIWQNYMNKVMLDAAEPTEMMNNATKEIDEILNESNT